MLVLVVVLVLIEKQEFVIAGFLNWGSLDIRGSADSLKLLTASPVTMHVAFSWRIPRFCSFGF